MDAKSQRSRIRPTRIRVGSTQARISDRREFASIGRKVASIARVGSVDRPPPLAQSESQHEAALHCNFFDFSSSGPRGCPDVSPRVVAIASLQSMIPVPSVDNRVSLEALAVSRAGARKAAVRTGG